MKHVLSASPADHLLSRLDPRVKLLTAGALLVMVISCTGGLFPLLAAILSLGIVVSLGVPLRLILLRFAEPAFIAVVVLLLKLFFSGGTPLLTLQLPWLELTAYREGLREGLLIAGRIAAAVSVVSAVGFSTSFTDLMAALAWLRVPRSFIEVALFAWRYLFLLLDDAQVIHAAQRNRLGYSGLRRGMRSFGTLAGALVLKAFDNSQTITTAMVQRGYDGNLPLFRHRPFRPAEVVLSALFVVAMGTLWGMQ